MIRIIGGRAATRPHSEKVRARLGVRSMVASMALLFFLTACAETQLVTHAAKQIPLDGSSASTSGIYKVGNPYQIKGVWYYPAEDYSYDETGIASWYGPGFHEKLTANGEIYNQNDLTAAHKTLPMPSLVRVTNLDNGRSIVVRINDRGPFVAGRIIDLSRRGAQLLGFEQAGTAKVRVSILAEESRAIAAVARSGGNTAGIVAVSDDGIPAPLPAPRKPVEIEGRPSPAAPIERVAFDPSQTVAGETTQGRFLPAPVVDVQPVQGYRQIFVQAGSFSVLDNAERLRARLSSIAPTMVSPIMVGDTQFFRVRLGPIESVDQADVILAQVIGAGNNGARVIVD